MTKETEQAIAAVSAALAVDEDGFCVELVKLIDSSAREHLEELLHDRMIQLVAPHEMVTIAMGAAKAYIDIAERCLRIASGSAETGDLAVAEAFTKFARRLLELSVKKAKVVEAEALAMRNGGMAKPPN